MKTDYQWMENTYGSENSVPGLSIEDQNGQIYPATVGVSYADMWRQAQNSLDIGGITWRNIQDYFDFGNFSDDQNASMAVLIDHTIKDVIWPWYYKAFINKNASNFRGVISGPLPSDSFASSVVENLNSIESPVQAVSANVVQPTNTTSIVSSGQQEESFTPQTVVDISSDFPIVPASSSSSVSNFISSIPKSRWVIFMVVIVLVYIVTKKKGRT